MEWPPAQREATSLTSFILLGPLLPLLNTSLCFKKENAGLLSTWAASHTTMVQCDGFKTLSVKF